MVTIWRPNRIASPPTIENLSTREKKTMETRRGLGYSMELAAAITGVKGNGGGAKQVTISAIAVRPLIFFLKYSKRLGDIIFSIPALPSFRIARSRHNTPAADPEEASITYKGSLR